jgi:uncharacterized repeat protein (TIGR01451 family)
LFGWPISVVHIMKKALSLLAAVLLCGIFLFGGVGICHAQIVYNYDASGNQTSSFLSASTGASTAAANSTQTIAIGAPLSLDVMASGSGPITYQWQLNGTNITGATDGTFFKANVSGGDAGSYRVIVTGAAGSQTNVLGTVTVVATTNTLFAIGYALNQYFAVGAIGSLISSSNLVAWAAPVSGTSNNLYGIAFGNNTLVAVGAAGTVLSSSNGVNWVVRNPGNAHDLMGVAFGNGIFVAAGAGGTTLTSPDGINWTTQTFDNPTLEAVTFATNLFVAVGTGGSIWTSSTGTNWIGHNWVTTDALNSVTFGNGLFVAAGTFGLILTSPDGSNWSPQIVNTIETFTSVLFFNSTFFAIGPIGANFISSNGTSWNENDAGTFEQLFGSVVGNGVPVAVGEEGTMLPIPYALVDHFAWSQISSPQRVGQSFSVTVTAKDAANNTLANFNGSATLTSTSSQSSITNTFLGNMLAAAIGANTFASGTNMSGYAFTPNADLLVTAVRHFDIANEVSIWDESGLLLASVAVTNISNVWVTTPLTAPLTLRAGITYVIGAYSQSGYFYRTDLANAFPDGTIDQAFNIDGTNVYANEFPSLPVSAFWFLVDLAYTVQRGQPNTVSPTSAPFVNGVANITPSVANAGQGVTLAAIDGSGHTGYSSPFNVYAANDLAVALTASPNPVTVQNNLTYKATVMNSGSSSASSVTVTNLLPSNISFVSANSTQGSCQYTNGQVTCNVGTLAGLASATITIIVTPTNAGVVLTNTVNVAQTGGSDPNSTNNSASITTYVPPTLSIGDLLAVEGNVGIISNQIIVTLSSPSILAVQFNVSTLDGTPDGTNSTPAVAGRDYVPLNEPLIFPPGSTSATFDVFIQGNTIVELTKKFFVILSNVTNATVSRSQGTVYILNDDGIAGQVNALVWSAVNSPQVTNQPFAASITARDFSGSTVTNFTGPLTLTGVNIGTDSTNTLINSEVASSSATIAISTVGYQFMPTNDIFVTHVRSYGGSKVSIWTTNGFVVASQAVVSIPGKWVDTLLPTPVHLLATNSYRIGVFTDGNTYYWGNSGPITFPDGEITAGYSSSGDSFPTNLDWPQWYLVDLRYARPASVTNSGSFTNGVWTGNVTVREIGTNFVLIADDNNGHIGSTSPFGIYATNDLAVTLSFSPSVPLVFTNITYTISVLNPGPNTSTGVLATNTLPAGATFVSAVSSQGTCSQTGGLVACNLGTINALSNATVTIVITPLVAGLPLTNSVSVTRNEADPNSGNNSAVSIVIPSLAVSLALSQATEYFLTPWRSGGDGLWGSVTNTTHDGIDAAKSGSIIDSQQSWMETTVRGPGTLAFWWKVSSQAAGDKFYFLTNNVAVTNISGNIDWQQLTFSVTPGLTFLRWNFVEDSSIHSGSNAAWLDQVSYTIPTFSFSPPTVDTNSSFLFTLNGTTGQQLILQTSTNLLQWSSISTNTVSGGVINYMDSSATNSVYRFYRAVFLNQ